MSAEPIIYGLIFIGVLVLVEGLYLVAFGKSISLNSRVNRRLEMLEKGARREEVLDKLRKEMQQHMNAKSIPLYSLLSERAQKAAIAFTPQQLLMIMAGLAVLAFLGLTIGTDTSVPVRAMMSVGMGVGAVEPGLFGLGPVPAVRHALERAAWSLASVERVEVNEAFAAIAIALVDELGFPQEIVNVEGGAIAHGHPIGATGAILTVRLIHAMQREGLKRGIVTLCIGGGQGIAAIFERAA